MTPCYRFSDKRYIDLKLLIMFSFLTRLDQLADFSLCGL